MNQPSYDQKSQFVRLDRGIGQFNHDYYAALGLPIITSPIYIRHVYLSIARILHPDIYGFSPAQKEIATQYLAKLVNPAYNILMKEQERKAYEGIFKLLAKRLMKKSRNIQIHSAVACELMMAPSDGSYERAVSAIANIQYQSLQNILECTGQISELNLVYILYKEGYQYNDIFMPPVLMPMVLPQSSKPALSADVKSPVKPNYSPKFETYQTFSNLNRQVEADETIIQTKSEAIAAREIGDRLRKCEIYMSQGDWKVALKELREILQLDKKNSKALAMLGVVYKNINQPQMAKISFQQSLLINPQEPLGLKYINDFNSPKPAPSPTSKKNPVSAPQKRSWLYNLLGWASPEDLK